MSEVVKKMLVQDAKKFLQVIYGDGVTGQDVQQLEVALRTKINTQKEEKRKPMGDYIKLLITHKAWGKVRIRDVLRDPEVVHRHPEPEVAETMWVCEKNVPPISTWLLQRAYIFLAMDLICCCVVPQLLVLLLWFAQGGGGAGHPLPTPPLPFWGNFGHAVRCTHDVRKLA